MSIETIIALVVATAGLITGIWTARSKANQSAIDDLAKAIKILRETIEGQQETIDRLEGENGRLRERVKELEHRNELQDAASLCLEDKVKLLEADKAQQNIKIQLLETDKAMLSAKVDQLEADNEMLRGRIAELERQK